MRWSQDMNAMPQLDLPAKLFFIGIRGDWKMKGYFTGVHEANMHNCCDECPANTVSPPYMSDLNLQAAWMAGKRRPVLKALERLLGRHPWMFFADLAHSLFLGHGPDFVGALLVVLARLQFPDFGLDDALHELYLVARGWCRSNGHRLACDTLSLAELQVDDVAQDYPHLRGKAWDCKVLCLWLAEFMGQSSISEQLPEETAAAQHLSSFIKELDQADIFLSEEQVK